ncbi:MAG: hypothetical protein Q9227_002571 [Pyrenula ochraceoflavens]
MNGSPNASPLHQALEEARTKYTSLHVRSLESHVSACSYLPGGNTRTVLHTSPFPLTISSATSCRLTTVDGITYDDFLGEYTAGIYGHSHPVIRAAVDSALDNGWNYGAHGLAQVELAKQICERFPMIQKVRFVNSGTEANMMALATAAAVTGRKKVLIFGKGYHGSTISGRVPDGKMSINLPHEFVLAPYNDIESTKAVLEQLPKDSLAAILVEPVLGSGGCYAGTKDFLNFLREAATSHGALLIFDEVMTSRLGYHGRGSALGIRPDLMTLGKWVGGGMTFGAFGGRNDIMALYDPRDGKLEHPGTFNNNVLSMNAGVAGMKLLTPEVMDGLNNLGEELKANIEKVLEEYGVTKGFKLPTVPEIPNLLNKADSGARPKMYIKGVGSLLNVHFSGPEKDTLQALFWHHMLDHGIYLAPRGFVALSIEIGKEEIARFVGAVRAFCERYTDSLRPERLSESTS